MSKAMEYNNHKIDGTSQKILLSLKSGSKETQELCDICDVENNNTITYRMREYLIPANLVELSGEKEKKRGINPAKIWELTIEGRNWVKRNEYELQRPTDAAEIEDTAAEALEFAQKCFNRVQELEGREGYLEQLQDELQGHLDDLERLADLVDRSETAAQTAQSERKKAAERVREAESVADEVGAGIDDLDDDLGRLSDDVTDLNNRLNDLRQRFSTLGDSTNERFGEIQKTQKRHENMIDSLGADISETQDRLDDIEERLEKPWYRRIFR
jgi:chromosome segregation ATPase